PVRRKRMARQAALRIREGVDEHQPLRALDLADQPFAPHLAAVGHAHAVVIGAAGTQVELGGDDAEALGAEPLLQALRLGPGLPNAQWFSPKGFSVIAAKLD